MFKLNLENIQINMTTMDITNISQKINEYDKLSLIFGLLGIMFLFLSFFTYFHKNIPKAICYLTGIDVKLTVDRMEKEVKARENNEFSHRNSKKKK